MERKTKVAPGIIAMIQDIKTGMGVLEFKLSPWHDGLLKPAWPGRYQIKLPGICITHPNQWQDALWQDGRWTTLVGLPIKRVYRWRGIAGGEITPKRYSIWQRGRNPEMIGYYQCRFRFRNISAGDWSWLYWTGAVWCFVNKTSLHLSPGSIREWRGLKAPC